MEYPLSCLPDETQAALLKRAVDAVVANQGGAVSVAPPSPPAPLPQAGEGRPAGVTNIVPFHARQGEVEVENFLPPQTPEARWPVWHRLDARVAAGEVLTGRAAVWYETYPRTREFEIFQEEEERADWGEAGQLAIHRAHGGLAGQTGALQQLQQSVGGW